MIYTDDNYRDFIAETIYRLDQLTDSLLEMQVNILMFGELSQTNTIFEAGDSFEFFPEHFENSEDENLKLVNKTIQKTKKTINAFKKMNNMDSDEVLDRLIEKFGELPD